LKKPTDSIQFPFYKPETEKNRVKPEKKNRVKQKTSQTRKNRAKTGKKPSQIKKTNQTRKNRAKSKKSSQTGLNQCLS
jgi:hypothetical protein